MNAPADPLSLYGTPEPLPVRRLLRAGPLSAVLENGNLRDIRFAGIEIVRAVNYLARDEAWGTMAATLADLAVAETPTAFDVRYSGCCEGPGGRFRYAMHIRGEALGRLLLEADGEALSDFHTNRTGFVVLHPAEAAGGALVIRHSDGSEEQTTFPRNVSPDQPAFDIAALTQRPVDGLAVTVAMEGEAFEMEDQRNWSDASFKTYVRPLSKPRPYVIPKGGIDRQRIVVSVEGTPPVAQAAASDGALRVELGEPHGRMPDVALFIDDSPVDVTGRFFADLAQRQIVRLWPDGRFAGAPLAGLPVAVELVMAARDPGAEAQAVRQHLAAAGVRPAALLVAPEREFRTRPSGTLPAGEQTTGALVAALRSAGFSCPIGAGTPSNFTEFNRNPPERDCDFVFFGIAANVHAADDLSVMETLETYPALIESAGALLPGKPIWLGPLTIGSRHNPYGAAVAPNPDGGRIACAREDPRQGALFGACFAAAAAAVAAGAGVAQLTVAAASGPFGLRRPDGRRSPIAAVQTELAAAAGADRVALLLGTGKLRGVAFRRSSGALRGLIANTGPETARLLLPHGIGSAWLIEADAGLQPLEAGGAIALEPYRTIVVAD